MTITPISFHASIPPPLPIRRFSVEQYHRLGEIGVLEPEDRVELLEGWIVEKMNQKPAHGFIVGELNQRLQTGVCNGYIVRCQLPITLAYSEPEPDLAVIQGSHVDYRDHHPGGKDCRLVIEVADTSLEKDRAKAAIYAAAGIEEYWIFSLIDSQVECRKNPDSRGAYQDTLIFSVNDTIGTTIGDCLFELPLNQLFDKK